MPSKSVRSEGLEALRDRIIGDDPGRAAELDRAYEDLKIGVALNALRAEAGLSVRALAQKVGTQPSVISRIEQADYEGHSLSMLRRVAAALGRRVAVTFPPIEEPAGKKASEKRAARGKKLEVS